MRVVLDTNVIVSAVLTTHGPCAQILDMLADGVFGIFADDRIFAEYDSVLSRPALRLGHSDVAEVMILIHSSAEPVAAVPLPTKLPDPGDMPFLEVAAAAAAILVTGNIRHFPNKSCAGITVLTPREFIDLVRCSP